MMMQMLAAGGVPTITDNVRVADESNTRGYYEHEQVKALRAGDHGWLKNFGGQAIKVVSPLLKHLPSQHHYKVIFMHRALDEVLASQANMLKNLGQSYNAENDIRLKRHYEQHLANVTHWLNTCDYTDECHLNYADILFSPDTQIKYLTDFLRTDIDWRLMRKTVDSKMRHHDFS